LGHPRHGVAGVVATAPARELPNGIVHRRCPVLGRIVPLMRMCGSR
jgi:hypothetical protein